MAKVIKVGEYEALVNDEDFEALSKITWYPYRHARNNNIYPRNRKKQFMHRVIMGITNPKIQIDHMDMNSLNNTKNNLRVCETAAQNAINRPKQKNNTSGYKGVFKRKYAKYKEVRYRAAIRVNQKLIQLGHFATAEEAAIVYNEAAVKYFGEFAFLNIIKGNNNVG